MLLNELEEMFDTHLGGLISAELAVEPVQGGREVAYVRNLVVM
jgi:hypothetical protein